MLKFEERFEGNFRKLIVKNITNNDLKTFTCEAKGEKTSAQLAQLSPWVEPLENAEGPVGGIAVLEVMVQPQTQVTWYVENKQITRKAFRLVEKLGLK